MMPPKRPTRLGRQLVFQLAGNPSYGSDEFLVAGCNEAAHATLMGWPNWPDRVLLLLGPAGSGKSHLAAMWATHSGAARLYPDAILEASHWTERHPSALHPSAILEDCDRLPFDEADLFHILNFVRETGGWLLLTARRPPDRWGLATPDLLSRLRLAPSVAIGSPDDGLIKAVLVKLFSDRQIAIDEDVVNYAARHCEQSLDGIRRFVTAVDEEALSSARRITRPLAAATISALDDG